MLRFIFFSNLKKIVMMLRSKKPNTYPKRFIFLKKIIETRPISQPSLTHEIHNPRYEIVKIP